MHFAPKSWVLDRLPTKQGEKAIDTSDLLPYPHVNNVQSDLPDERSRRRHSCADESRSDSFSFEITGIEPSRSECTGSNAITLCQGQSKRPVSIEILDLATTPRPVLALSSYYQGLRQTPDKGTNSTPISKIRRQSTGRDGFLKASLNPETELEIPAVLPFAATQFEHVTDTSVDVGYTMSTHVHLDNAKVSIPLDKSDHAANGCDVPLILESGAPSAHAQTSEKNTVPGDIAWDISPLSLITSMPSEPAAGVSISNTKRTPQTLPFTPPCAVDAAKEYSSDSRPQLITDTKKKEAVAVDSLMILPPPKLSPPLPCSNRAVPTFYAPQATPDPPPTPSSQGKVGPEAAPTCPLPPPPTRAARYPLKQVFWNTIPENQAKLTIFANADHAFVEEFIEQDELEKLFAARPRPSAKVEPVQSTQVQYGCTEFTPCHSADSLVTLSVTPNQRSSSKKYVILSARRSMTFDILLHKFRADPKSISQAVCSLDPLGKVLSTDNIQALHETDIKDDEFSNAEVLIDLSDDQVSAMMSRSDALVYFAARTKRWRPAIAAMLAIRTLPAEADRLCATISKVALACDQIKSSKMLARLLGFILRVGNRLNQGTRRGQAKAFKLDSLLKLTDTKAQDHKLTLLHYIVSLLSKQEPEIFGVLQELNLVSDASKLSLDDIGSEVSSFAKNVEALGTEIQKQQAFLRPEAESSEDAVAAQAAYAGALQRQLELETDLESAKSQFRHVATYLGENGSKAKIHGVFGTLVTFFEMIDKCVRDNTIYKPKRA